MGANDLETKFDNELRAVPHSSSASVASLFVLSVLALDEEADAGAEPPPPPLPPVAFCWPDCLVWLKLLLALLAGLAPPWLVGSACLLSWLKVFAEDRGKFVSNLMS